MDVYVVAFLKDYGKILFVTYSDANWFQFNASYKGLAS